MMQPEADTVQAVLAKGVGEAYGKGFWAEWVRAVFWCEGQGLVMVTQRGSGTEGPATFRRTEVGQTLLDMLERRAGDSPTPHIAQIRLLADLYPGLRTVS